MQVIPDHPVLIRIYEDYKVLSSKQMFNILDFINTFYDDDNIDVNRFYTKDSLFYYVIPYGTLVGVDTRTLYHIDKRRKRFE